MKVQGDDYVTVRSTVVPVLKDDKIVKIYGSAIILKNISIEKGKNDIIHDRDPVTGLLNYNGLKKEINDFLEHSGKNALDFQLVTFLGYLIAKEKADSYYIISRDTGFQSAVLFCQSYLGIKVHLKPSIKTAIGYKPKKDKKKDVPQEPAVTVKKPAKAQPVLKKAKKAEVKPEKKKGKAASVSLRKKATVIQVQPVSGPVYAEPHEESVPIDLETVLTLVQPAVNVDTATEILHCLQASHSKTEFHNALQQHFDNDNVKQYYHCMKPCFITFVE